MSLRQRPSAWDNLAVSVNPNRLELPDATDKLEVANVQTGFGEHLANAGADELKPKGVVHAITSQTTNYFATTRTISRHLFE